MVEVCSLGKSNRTMCLLLSSRASLDEKSHHDRKDLAGEVEGESVDSRVQGITRGMFGGRVGSRWAPTVCTRCECSTATGTTRDYGTVFARSGCVVVFLNYGWSADHLNLGGLLLVELVYERMQGDTPHREAAFLCPGIWNRDRGPGSADTCERTRSRSGERHACAECSAACAKSQRCTRAVNPCQWKLEP